MHSSARLLNFVGQTLVNQSYRRASKVNKPTVVSKVNVLPKLMKLLCELSGWGWFVYAAFSINPIAGKIVAGVAFLVFAFRIEVNESPSVAVSNNIDPTLRGKQ